jgi:hypothetical protein
LVLAYTVPDPLLTSLPQTPDFSSAFHATVPGTDRYTDEL